MLRRRPSSTQLPAQEFAADVPNRKLEVLAKAEHGAADGTSREYIIVGADVIPKDGQWRIDGDIADEEEGTIFFELPNAPFSVSSFDELRVRVLAATDELIAPGKPVLIRLLGSAALVANELAGGCSEGVNSRGLVQRDYRRPI